MSLPPHDLNDTIARVRDLKAARDFWREECLTYKAELEACERGIFRAALAFGFGVTLATVLVIVFV